jgi:hypothetical protein
MSADSSNCSISPRLVRVPNSFTGRALATVAFRPLIISGNSSMVYHVASQINGRTVWSRTCSDPFFRAQEPSPSWPPTRLSSSSKHKNGFRASTALDVTQPIRQKEGQIRAGRLDSPSRSAYDRRILASHRVRINSRTPYQRTRGGDRPAPCGDFQTPRNSSLRRKAPIARRRHRYSGIKSELMRSGQLVTVTTGPSSAVPPRRVTPPPGTTSGQAVQLRGATDEDYCTFEASPLPPCRYLPSPSERRHLVFPGRITARSQCKPPRWR